MEQNRESLHQFIHQLSTREISRLSEYMEDFLFPERMQKFRKVLEERTSRICVVLENVYQSQNASAILRTCDCTGIQEVYIIEQNNRYEISSDVALGAEKWLNLHYAPQNIPNNTLHTYQALREQGYTIAATCLHQEAVSLEDLELDRKIALVFGTERQGLTSSAIANADTKVYIPMRGFTESYNVSVAAAVSLFYLTKKLRDTGCPWHLSEEERMRTLLFWQMSSVKDSINIARKEL